MRLTEAQRRGLIELCAACDESIRYNRGIWVRTYDLCGTKQERSSANLLSLVKLGLAEANKPPTGYPQQQWYWRITEAGRRLLSEEERDG